MIKAKELDDITPYGIVFGNMSAAKNADKLSKNSGFGKLGTLFQPSIKISVNQKLPDDEMKVFYTGWMYEVYTLDAHIIHVN